MNILITNISELVTFSPLALQGRSNYVTEPDLGLVKNAWLVIENKKIKSFGSMQQLPNGNFSQVIDANNSLILPGLVDAHTHPIFAGTRHNEFAMRLNGKTYQDIAAQGGGIKATVHATRKASNSELKELTQKRLQQFLEYGVTTVEAKSGYGLSTKEELRLLQILDEINLETTQQIIPTCLALHALPPEENNYENYVSQVTKELLPEVAKQKLAHYVDAFIETGYFSVEHCEPYFAKAQELGLGIRIHADEFSDAKAAWAAGRWQAASADHLQAASAEGQKMMAENNVTAIILPGTSIYTNIPYTKAKPYFELGCSVALATDFNPGSCLVNNLPFIATMGALHCGLNVAQAIAAVTFVPAKSLGLANKGALAVGYDADFIICQAKEAAEWLADMGRTKPSSVWIQGQCVK